MPFLGTQRVKEEIMKKLFVIIIVICASTIPLHSKEKASEIAKKMIDRNDGRTIYTKSMLVSCYYDNVKGKMKCKSDPRKKLLESIMMDTGKRVRTQSVLRF